MQIFLDIRTLALFNGFVSACIAICMLYIYIKRKTYPGFNLWTIAFLLKFIGWVLISLRGLLPTFATVIVANTLILACYVIIARGLIDFVDGRQNVRLDVLLLLLFVFPLVYFSYVQVDINARIMFTSLVTAAVSLRCALVAYRKIPLILGEGNGLLTATFTAMVLWFLVRAILTILIEEKIQDFMSAGILHGLTLIIASIVGIFGAVGLVIINAQRLEQSLTKTKKEIKTLKGFLPICASCKKIRDDEGYWNQIESYIAKHTDAEFSHGICPECTKKLYPDIDIDS